MKPRRNKRETRCPACAYDLGGIDGAVCPERGVDVSDTRHKLDSLQRIVRGIMLCAWIQIVLGSAGLAMGARGLGLGTEMGIVAILLVCSYTGAWIRRVIRTEGITFRGRRASILYGAVILSTLACVALCLWGTVIW